MKSTVPKVIAIPAKKGTVVSAVAGSPKKRWYSRILTQRFLFVSILVHLLFALVATYYVVQTITAKRKLTFQGGPASPKPSQHAVEHQVQAAKRKHSSSMAVQARRVLTTGVSNIALPDLPAMSSSMMPTVSKITGITGGNGLGMTVGGADAGGGAGGGAGLTMFGYKSAGGAGFLKGYFYDLKQTKDGKPTNMTPDEYGKIVDRFVRGSWSDASLAHYFRSPKPIYASQIFIPSIDADLGPAAFDLQDKVQPRMWLVHYKGRVSPPESGNYHFVGAGDDVLCVKFNGRVVLNACWYVRSSIKGDASYIYNVEHPNGFMKGPGFYVDAGQFYNMDVLIGEQPGGRCYAFLMLQKDGEQYQKEEHGSPILPIFTLNGGKPAPVSGEVPPHREDGRAWTAAKPESEPAMGGLTNPFSNFK